MTPSRPRATAPGGSPATVAAFERDRALLSRWQNGDREAGAELLDHYAPFVRQVSRRMGIRGEADFLDFWQELLLRVLNHLPHLHERVHKSFAGYLAWQARDLAGRFRARRGAQIEAPDRAVHDDDGIERSEFWRAVTNCEEALPDGERPVFAMRFRDGLSLGEVAARTNSNANAVAQAVFRLVRRMRACLERRGFGMPGGES